MSRILQTIKYRKLVDPDLAAVNEWDTSAHFGNNYETSDTKGAVSVEDSETWKSVPTQRDQWFDSSSGTEKSGYILNQDTNLAHAEIKNTTSGQSYVGGDGQKIKRRDPMIILPADESIYNGTIKVRGYGGMTDLDTSLRYNITHELYDPGDPAFDDLFFQNNNGIFPALREGNWTLDIRDSSDLSAATIRHYSEIINVPIREVFAARYKASFTDSKGQSIDVEIQEKGYIGDTEDICLGADPLILSSDIIDNDFSPKIVPIDIVLIIMQEYSGQFDAITRGEEENWRVQIQAENLNITGKLLIEQLLVPHLDSPIPLSLNFVAGLSGMGEKTISGWGGKISFMDVIAFIQLNYNNTQHDIREFIGMQSKIYEDNQEDYTRTTLNAHFINAATFNGMKPKEVINSILRTFGSTLMQDPQGWISIYHIAYSTLVGKVIEGARYGADGRFLDIADLPVSLIDVECGGDDHYIDRAQSYSILPKVGEFSIIVEFEEVVEYHTDMIADHWFGNGTGFPEQEITQETQDGEDSVGLRGWSTDFNYDDSIEELNDWIGMTAEAFNVFGEGIRIEMELAAVPVAGTNLSIQTIDDNSVYFGLLAIFLPHEGDINNTYSLDREEKELVNGHGKINVLSIEETLRETKIGVDSAAWVENKVKVLDSGRIKPWVFGILESRHISRDVRPTWLNVTSLSLKVLLPETYETDNTPTVFNEDSNGYSEDERKIKIGDVPTKVGYGLDIGGAVVIEDLTPTDQWVSRYSESLDITNMQNYRNLIGFLGNAVTNLKGKSTRKLSGVIFTDYPNIATNIYDKTLDGMFLSLQEFSYSVKFNKMGFSAIEILQSTGRRTLEQDGLPDEADRVLESGSFNYRDLQ